MDPDDMMSQMRFENTLLRERGLRESADYAVPVHGVL